MTRLLNSFPSPRHLLVQWVPHAFGFRALNVPFSFWLWNRARVHGDRVDVMVHEPFLAFREGTWLQDTAAAVQRGMVWLILRNANRIFVSTSSWERYLRPYCAATRTFEWLPVPSNIPVPHAAGMPALLKTERATLGHFGTYGPSIAKMLIEWIPALLKNLECNLLLLGRGSQEIASSLVSGHPDIARRIMATGHVSPDILSKQLLSCQIMVQPFPDGVTARRTSVIAALAHGRPVITTEGRLTESWWKDNAGVRLIQFEDIDALVREITCLVSKPRAMALASLQARTMYETRFDVTKTIHILRNEERRRSCLAPAVENAK